MPRSLRQPSSSFSGTKAMHGWSEPYVTSGTLGTWVPRESDTLGWLVARPRRNCPNSGPQIRKLGANLAWKAGALPLNYTRGQAKPYRQASVRPRSELARLQVELEGKHRRTSQAGGWSGRADSNRRPLAPKASALTKLRHAPRSRPGGTKPLMRGYGLAMYGPGGREWRYHVKWLRCVAEQRKRQGRIKRAYCGKSHFP
jgi:hypothetical protein